MSTQSIGDELKPILKSHGGYLNHWVGGIFNITFQTLYDIQYLTIRFSGYMNTPKEPEFLSLVHGMEYLVHHPQKVIMYSRKNIFNLNERPLQCFFSKGSVDINKNQ